VVEQPRIEEEQNVTRMEDSNDAVQKQNINDLNLKLR
jgi:hypothetical protein